MPMTQKVKTSKKILAEEPCNLADLHLFIGGRPSSPVRGYSYSEASKKLAAKGLIWHDKQAPILGSYKDVWKLTEKGEKMLARLIAVLDEGI